MQARSICNASDNDAVLSSTIAFSAVLGGVASADPGNRHGWGSVFL